MTSRFEKVLKQPQTLEALSKFFRKTIVKNRIQRAIRIEKDSACDADVPVLLELNDAQEPWSRAEAHQNENPHFERKKTYVKNNNDTH